MLKTLLLFAVALAIAVGGGAASAWLALESFGGVGTVAVGNWTARPFEGTDRADPYTKARFSRERELTLGQVEGIRFIAHADSTAEPLRRNCTYAIEGNTPPTRFWTLYAAASLTETASLAERPTSFYSRAVLRNADNGFTLSFGPDPVPGNWRRVTGTGPMVLVLTLYDTPVANQSGLAGIEMPRIVRKGCARG